MAFKSSLTQGPIQLSMLCAADEAELIQIAQDPRIWAYNPSFNDPKEFQEKWFQKARAQQGENMRIPLVIRYNEKIIGSSSYYDFDPEKRTLNIGYTWLIPEYWGKGINAVVKELMLTDAFENGIIAVYFVIDSLNKRSQQAVLKLGAHVQGIYRDHMKRPDCTMRDSIIYVLESDKHFLSKK